MESIYIHTYEMNVALYLYTSYIQENYKKFVRIFLSLISWAYVENMNTKRCGMWTFIRIYRRTARNQETYHISSDKIDYPHTNSLELIFYTKCTSTMDINKQLFLNVTTARITTSIDRICMCVFVYISNYFPEH